jgi:uncharacterized protein YjiS (DUF1127 family)
MRNLAQTNNQENIVRGTFRKGYFVRALQRFRSWNERRLAVIELNAMPDSLLRDLGIERYEINDVVNQTGTFVKLPIESSNEPAVTPLHKAAA